MDTQHVRWPGAFVQCERSEYEQHGTTVEVTLPVASSAQEEGMA